MLRLLVIILVSLFLHIPFSAAAGEQPPDIAGITTIHDLMQTGQYFVALSRAGETNTLTIDDRLAAAKSAWALGLVEKARQYWDEVFASKQFGGAERNRELLARAAMELQEQNYEKARAIAEQAAAGIQQSDLRAEFYMIAGESLREQGNLSQAQVYYSKAAQDAAGRVKSEALCILGECQLKLGLINEARYSFTSVEMSSKQAPLALRRLAEIDLLQRNYDGVLTWLGEGRESYAADFEDSWTGYATITALLELDRIDDAKSELERMRARHSDRSSWYQLADASYESKAVANAVTELKDGK